MRTLSRTAQRESGIARHLGIRRVFWEKRFGHGFDCLTNQRLATSNAPRMLTPSEIALLKQSKREIAIGIKSKKVSGAST